MAESRRRLSETPGAVSVISQESFARREALALLHRHFFRYERYQAVRAKEMMEARVDAVFDSLRNDRSFMALTKGADGMLPMPMRDMRGNQNQQR